MSDTGWMSDALCAQTGGDFFTLDKGDSYAPAKKICAQCDVRAQCLQYALDNDLGLGIYGGLSPAQRKALRKAAA